MLKEAEFENNYIGTAIQYFRELYVISQSKLCKGLCSVSTLSRIEAGERDADALLLETLLERLGKTPNQFELILSDFDYEAYLCRKEICNRIEDKEIDEAYRLINEYSKIAEGKVSPHKQFIMVRQAHLNELEGGKSEKTIDLLMEAITYTVPDFNTSSIYEYFLSESEFNIIMDILEKMISLRMIEAAEKVIDQIIDYLYWHKHMEQNRRIYPKVASVAGKFYIEQNQLGKALQICNRGLENHKGSYKMEYLGDLIYINAQVTERSLKSSGNWVDDKKKECLKMFLEAYYIYDICDDITEADKIRKHVQEEYQWEDID